MFKEDGGFIIDALGAGSRSGNPVVDRLSRAAEICELRLRLTQAGLYRTHAGSGHGDWRTMRTPCEKKERNEAGLHRWSGLPPPPMRQRMSLMSRWISESLRSVSAELDRA